MIFKNLFRRKTRTLLTTFGIAIGVAAVVALGAMAEGFLISYGTLGSGADLTVSQRDAVDIAFSSVDMEVGATLAGLSGVTAVNGMVYTFGATEGMPYFIVYGYEPNGFAIEKFRIVEGEALHTARPARGGRPLVMGRAAAADLEKRVGDSFRIYETTYRIVGIYETGQPFEDGAAVVSLEDAQLLSGKPRQVNAFLIQVRDENSLAALRARIEARYDNLVTATAADFVEQQEMLAYVDAFTWAVSLIAIIIGGVGVMNTMLMSVFERTRELGVLRAIGWRPGQVLGMIMSESLVLSCCGGLVGAGLGIGCVWLVKSLPFGGLVFPQIIYPGRLLQGFLVALGLGGIGGLYPAWRAAQLLPAEAMRYEGGTVQLRRQIRLPGVRDLLRQPTRMALTMVSIGVAIMAIVMLGGLGAGLATQFTGMVGGGGAQLVGMEANASIDLSKIDEGILRRMALLPGVTAAEGFLTGYTIVGDLPFFIVYGYQPRGLGIRNFRVVEGEPLTGNRQILLGRVAAENLERSVGQTLRIFNSSYKIVGIYETGVPFEDGGGVISLRDAQNLFGQPRKVSFLAVWVDDPREAEAVAALIESRHPEVAVSLVSDFAKNVGDLQMMDAAIWGISLMALLVGGLGMTNTMVMSVLERTREIGVLRALGWRKRRVLGIILRESVLLSMLGGLAGCVVGVLFALLFNLHPLAAGYIKAEFSAGLLAQALGTALLLGAIGGIYPAWRAASLLPVEALRYE